MIASTHLEAICLGGFSFLLVYLHEFGKASDAGWEKPEASADSSKAVNAIAKSHMCIDRWVSMYRMIG